MLRTSKNIWSFDFEQLIAIYLILFLSQKQIIMCPGLEKLDDKQIRRMYLKES